MKLKQIYSLAIISLSLLSSDILASKLLKTTSETTIMPHQQPKQHPQVGKNKTGKLINAVRNGNLPAVKKILKQCTCDLCEEYEGNTVLHYAVAWRSIKIIYAILQDEDAMNIINLPNKEGYTPLTIAAIYRDKKVTKLLIDHGAAVDQLDKRGFTALHMALLWNKPGCVAALCAAKANTNIKDKHGKTPSNYDSKGLLVQNTLKAKKFKIAREG